PFGSVTSSNMIHLVLKDDSSCDPLWIDSSVVHPSRDNDDLIDLIWDHVDVATKALDSLRWTQEVEEDGEAHDSTDEDIEIS
ncbi:hypothetical protein ACJX0J_009377, partial [Zea mays]